MRYVSTRGSAPVLGFADAMLTGLAPDGGLYVPEVWPRFTGAQITALRELSYPELVAAVSEPFVEGDVADLPGLAAAASAPFETWILPTEHRHDFALSSDDELRGLAVILRDFLRRVRSLLDDPPYHLVHHTIPNPHPRPGRPDYWATIEHDYHWHIEFAPYTRRLAGFEWGSGYTINPTPPEEAARLLTEVDPEGD